jgi:hypothetical protein
MMMMNERILQFARILLRFALGITFPPSGEELS